MHSAVTTFIWTLHFDEFDWFVPTHYKTSGEAHKMPHVLTKIPASSTVIPGAKDCEEHLSRAVDPTLRQLHLIHESVCTAAAVQGIHGFF